MITVHWDEGQKQILLTPNRSMSWRNNQLILLSMLFVSIVIAIRFFYWEPGW